MNLSWRRNKVAIGVRRIKTGPRGSSLYLDKFILCATVSELLVDRVSHGWYWVAGWSSGIPEKSTHSDPVATQDHAQADAMAYVYQYLGAAPQSLEVLMARNMTCPVIEAAAVCKW